MRTFCIKQWLCWRVKPNDWEQSIKCWTKLRLFKVSCSPEAQDADVLYFSPPQINLRWRSRWSFRRAWLERARIWNWRARLKANHSKMPVSPVCSISDNIGNRSTICSDMDESGSWAFIHNENSPLPKRFAKCVTTITRHSVELIIQQFWSWSNWTSSSISRYFVILLSCIWGI